MIRADYKFSVTRQKFLVGFASLCYLLILFGGTYYFKIHQQQTWQVLLLIICGIIAGGFWGCRGRGFSLASGYFHVGYCGATFLLLLCYRLPLTYGAYIYPVISSYYLYGILGGFCLVRALFSPPPANR